MLYLFRAIIVLYIFKTADFMRAVPLCKIYTIFRQYSRRQISGQCQLSLAHCSGYVFRDGQDKGSARLKATQVQEALTHDSAPRGFRNRDTKALVVEDGALVTNRPDGMFGSRNSPNIEINLNKFLIT